jgi:hypothetical protein
LLRDHFRCSPDGKALDTFKTPRQNTELQCPL